MLLENIHCLHSALHIKLTIFDMVYDILDDLLSAPDLFMPYAHVLQPS